MTSRIKIFDHFCQPLTEITVTTTNRNWVLNDYGRAEFSIGYSPKESQASQVLREEWFQFGNLVHIVHNPTASGGKLPDWTGIILPIRNWDVGVCHITAYSAESILMWRAMKYTDISGTPKTIVSKIIENANARATNIRFMFGVQDDIPATFSDRLSTNAYNHLKKVCSDSGMDWDVTGFINNKGNLDFKVNLYKKKGQEIEYTLQSGDGGNVQLESPAFSEQGSLYNQIFGYSQAQTDNSRVGPIEIVNQESYDLFGPLQLNQVLVGKKDKTSVENATKTLAESRGFPVKVIKRTILDLEDAFWNPEIGNTLKIKDTNVGFNKNGYYGFEATARIIAMDYNDLSNKVPLKVEVL